jgi:hypothetical protein
MASDALDGIGDHRRMALPGVPIELDQRRRLPVTLTARQESSPTLFVGQVNVAHRPFENM